MKAQIERLCGEIAMFGEGVATPEQLSILCEGVSASGQWNSIAKIAMEQHWSFTFLSNGSVRFARF
ncbi:MAG TPA: hypothetical protein VGW39_14475 [Chthoniobacterales bacterium]|nr:hypothetical protein [Chthoniobacterales bacterium]